jgi:hypothetical protein
MTCVPSAQQRPYFGKGADDLVHLYRLGEITIQIPKQVLGFLAPDHQRFIRAGLLIGCAHSQSAIPWNREDNPRVFGPGDKKRILPTENFHRKYKMGAPADPVIKLHADSVIVDVAAAETWHQEYGRMGQVRRVIEHDLALM